MNIIQHTEKFLGKISKGWDEVLSKDGLQVVCFKNSPFKNIDSFLTLGLSHHKLKTPKKEVRQELVLPASGITSPEAIISTLLFLCELVLKSHQSLLRGQVIKLPKGAVEKFGFEAVYCAIPVFMEDSFATLDGEPPTVIVWIMPIYESEANYIYNNGWEQFEDLLQEEEPDLFSLNRDVIV